LIVLTGLLSLACTFACGPSAVPQEHSLLASFEMAAVFPVETVIDLQLGSEERAPEHELVLGSGWSRVEKWGTWAIGARSTIIAHLLATGSQHLYFECQPYLGTAEDPQQAVTVRVNGNVCGTVVLQRGWHQYTLPIAGGLLRAGTNEIVLAHRYHHSPRELGRGHETRQLANGFRKLGLVQANQPAHIDLCSQRPVRVDHEARRVVLTRPGSLVVPLDLASGRRQLLLSAAVETDRQAPDPLELGLSLLDPDGKETELATFTAGADSDSRTAVLLDGQTIDLPAGDGGLHFLLLDARFVGGEARLVLNQPRLLVTPGGLVQETRPRPESSSLPDIVLVILDAARADHFGCYGYSRPTTPAIDRFARQSLVFENVIAHASYTTCSVPTMVTGLPFTRHGLVYQSQQIAAEVTTLAEHLRGQGYVTVGMTANPHHAATRGLHQGYDEWLETWNQPGRVGRRALNPHVLSELAIARLEQGFGEQPGLMVLHYIPPHWPYIPPKRFDIFGDPAYQGELNGEIETLLAFKENRQDLDADDKVRLMSLYDGNLLRVDDAVDQLLQALQQRPRWSDTVVLMTSDHGEAFYEHGFHGHSRTLYEEMLRVPFILRLPQRLTPDAVDRERFASLADIVPTLLALTGIDPDPAVTGADLLAPAGRQTRSWVISRTAGKRSVYGISTGRWKALINDNHSRELYDLQTDPGERRNLAAERPRLLAGLTQIVRQTLAQDQVIGNQATSAPPASDEERKALEALGYVN
jgi:arylsulfatase A-like enzyme